jgi:hypothetical protein
MVIAVCLLWAVPAHAQRMQFPTMVTEDSPFYSPPFDSGAVSVPQTAPLAPGWDPYAAPGSTAPAVVTSDPGYAQAAVVATEPKRLIQGFYTQYAWLNGGGNKDPEINEIEMNVSMGFPFLGNPNLVLVTPGIAVDFFDGPVSNTIPGSPDLPGSVYSAYLETSWKPRVNNWLTGDLAVRVGVNSDFNHVTSDSIVVTGKGLGLVTLSPTLTFALGVAYVNRLNIKILPAGGLIWVPNPDNRFEIIFPTPKYAHRIRTVGNTDWWLYALGRYGGGQWTIERADGGNDRMGYNDIRIAGGIEFMHFRGWKGWFDVAYVWNREVLYVTQSSNYDPSDTVALTAGVAF